MHALAVKVDAVSGFEHQHLVLDGEFQCALKYKVELLSVVRVLCVFLVAWQRIYLREEGIHLAVAEASGQALVLVIIAPCRLV